MNAGWTELIDNDGDGYVTEENTCDFPVDCDDNDPDVQACEVNNCEELDNIMANSTAGFPTVQAFLQAQIDLNNNFAVFDADANAIFVFDESGVPVAVAASSETDGNNIFAESFSAVDVNNEVLTSQLQLVGLELSDMAAGQSCIADMAAALGLIE